MARFAEAFLKKLNASFIARSAKAKDQLGNEWKPLADITHYNKQLTLLEEHPFVIQRQRGKGVYIDYLQSTKGLVASKPTQAKQWRDVYNQKRQEGLSHIKAVREANKATGAGASAAMSKKSYKLKGVIRETPINVRTGRLIRATEPGSIVGSRYYPSKDQTVRINKRSVYVSFKKIPYADEVDKGGTFSKYTKDGFEQINVPARPIIPPNAAAWLPACHAYAKPFAQAVYDRILAQQRAIVAKRRQKRNDRRNS
jgi:hypothetical protein